jgi:leucine dehydrogenase
MSVFQQDDFDGHEQVAFFNDDETGLRAIIAVHNTNLGPALGGVRMWPYASDSEAVRDVLRLSRGMTYKSALAGLPFGGGKSVIIGDPHRDKNDALMRAMGRCVDKLAGRYIAAEDSGTSVADLQQMATQTDHVVGIVSKNTAAGELRSGDPSPATARGVFVGLQAAVRHKFGRSDLEGTRVAVQGVGNVGLRLVQYLHDAGARCWISDTHAERVERAVDEMGATPVAADDILGLEVDVFAPCALGAVLNSDSIPQLQARVVAGAANNQLQNSAHGATLLREGILYAPDYVINAGGVIDVAFERTGYDLERVVAKVEGIASSLEGIFERSDHEQRPTSEVADDVARERFMMKMAA